MNKAYIAKTGMITAVGGDTVGTATTVAAGVSAMAEGSIYNSKFRAMKLATIPDDALPKLQASLAAVALSQKQSRMIRSFSVALRQCLDARITAPLPLFLALPDFIPQLPQTNFSGFLKHVSQQAGVTLDLPSSRSFYLGRAGGIYALQMAFNYLVQTGEDFVLVGGVDSPLDHGRLAYWDYQRRILSLGAQDAFAPGEAACCLLVASPAGYRQLGLQSACSFFEPAVSVEPGHFYSMQPCFGNGLTDAFRNALIPSAADEINHIITTLNGEGIHAKELGVAMTRNQAKMAPDVAVHHPADCFGDIGAAFTTVLLGTTAFNLEQGAVSGNCLIYGSSDTEYRGAVVLQG